MILLADGRLNASLRRKLGNTRLNIGAIGFELGQVCLSLGKLAIAFGGLRMDVDSGASKKDQQNDSQHQSYGRAHNRAESRPIVATVHKNQYTTCTMLFHEKTRKAAGVGMIVIGI